jgi:hypothetical protein
MLLGTGEASAAHATGRVHSVYRSVHPIDANKNYNNYYDENARRKFEILRKNFKWRLLFVCYQMCVIIVQVGCLLPLVRFSGTHFFVDVL